MKVFLAKALPSVVTIMFTFIPILCNIAIGGHREDVKELAVIGLGGATVQVLFSTFLFGINEAQNTLTP